MDDLSTRMPEHDQHEQNPESGGWNCEQIDCGQVRHVIFHKRAPPLGWRLGITAGHQVGNRWLGYLDSQLEQLAVNPGCTPKPIGFSHPANKLSDIRTDRRPPGTFSSGLELLDATAATVNHEINNLLQAILGTVQLMGKDEDKFDEDTKKKLKLLEQSSLAIMNVTRRLMNVSEIKYTDYVNGTKMLDISTDENST